MDIAVIECGLGGRGDATNVRSRAPEVAILTSIGLDHTDLLGETVGEIAAEKSGIFRRSAPAVYSALVPPQARAAIERASTLTGCSRLIVAPPAERTGGGGRAPVRAQWGGCEFEVGIMGGYQVENAGVAFAALRELREGGGWKISDEDVCKGMADARMCGWE